MEFNIVLHQVLILFIILAIGYVAGKCNILDSNGTKKLSEVLLYIAVPSMVFSSFFIELSQERLVNIAWMLGFSFFMFIFSIIFSKLFFLKFNEQVNPILRFIAIFSNCGYMGIPLMKAIFGDEGAFYGSFYIVLFNVFVWSYGYMLFGGENTKSELIKRVLFNPALISVYAGTIVFLLQIPIPEVVKGAVKTVGDTTMPLSMMIIGGVISTEKLSSLFNDWRVYLSAFVRLILMPVVAFFIALWAGVPSIPAAITVTALAMPAAANAAIFPKLFGGDAVFASKCVAVTNLLSLITVPVILSWVASHV
ncbi:MAG: AEC family transporter [Acetivibrionales bacterium]|jgi:predicted permease